jgi:hypothetical protein
MLLKTKISTELAIPLTSGGSFMKGNVFSAIFSATLDFCDWKVLDLDMVVDD